MFRPAVVSEYRAPGAATGRYRAWLMITWAATLGGGLFGVFNNTYKGEHALSGVQKAGREWYDRAFPPRGGGEGRG